MPILPKEADRFPAELFETGTADSRRWWVLHTKPRQEKSLARQLAGASVPFFLPTIGRQSRVRNQLLYSQLPLFPSYLFLKADRDERTKALRTNRVVKCLEVPDQGRLDADLRQVDQLICSGLPVTAADRIGPGSAVEVTSGPLAGLRGTVIRSAAGRRFIVKVDFIQQGAAVEFRDFDLQPADDDQFVSAM